MTALAWGCAGELDADPTSFKSAYVPIGTSTGGTTGTGGTVGATGGTTGTTGGTTGTGGSSDMIPPDDPCVATVFQTNACVACHSAALSSGGLNLDGGNLGARLSMTKAMYKDVANMAACVPNALIIDPVTPANSILLKKVAGTQACGDKMPQGTGLSGDNLKCITDWINKF